MKKHLVKQELIVGLCVMVIAVIYGILTPFQASGYTEGNSISGRALPLCIAALLGFLGASHSYNNWRLYKSLPPDREAQEPLDKPFIKRVVLYLLAACAYVAGIEYIGFIVSSLVIIPCFILLSGGKNKVALIATTIIAPLVLYAIFTVVMEIYLPEGLFI
ncbi:tripartite tricarboxylate transporter TctB family protein [Desulfovibrio sp. OttesenSCG-928-O18]|nr:tripartite tricarboxylate transporter TctB family protein [Desulfovibrio sp. OttesenSCG-928-O18]